MIYNDKRKELLQEFRQLRNDNADFANLYSDTVEDFEVWVMDYEIDADWALK
jgi:hypothetical protein